MSFRFESCNRHAVRLAIDVLENQGELEIAAEMTMYFILFLKDCLRLSVMKYSTYNFRSSGNLSFARFGLDVAPVA